MRAIHSFVAEIFGKFVHTVETADNKALQVQLVGNTQVERDIQRIVVGNKRPCGSAPGNGLQDGCFHLEITILVKHLPHGVDYFGPLDKNVLHLRVDNQIDIPLAVALLRIGKSIVGFPVFFLYNGQRAQRFVQHSKLFYMNGNFAHLCAEYKTFYADNISDVEQLLKNLVVHGFVVAGANLVAVYINLYPPGMILQFGKRSLPHHPETHQTSGKGNIREIVFCVIVIFPDFSSRSIHFILGCRVRINTQFAQLLQRISSDQLLLTQFQMIHCLIIFSPTETQFKKIFAKIIKDVGLL